MHIHRNIPFIQFTKTRSRKGHFVEWKLSANLSENQMWHMQIMQEKNL
jgi:hypothetical protein